MKHLKELVEKIKALPHDEQSELVKLLKADGVMTLSGCPQGYVSDGKGGCVLNPLPPDPTHPTA